MSKHGFGRNPSTPDARNWPVSRLIAMIEEGTAVPVTWADPVVLDQGQTPHCVGFAGAGFIATAEVNVPGDPSVNDQLGHDLYRACKVVDQDPLGENGSSVHTLVEVLKQKGIIDHYAFASDTTEVTAWLDAYGPAVTGLSWYMGMEYPTDAGVMHRTGSIVGGHATIIHGISVQGLDFVNSWGKLWGLSGHAYLPIAEFEPAMHEMGEVACCVKLTAPGPTPPTPTPTPTPPPAPPAPPVDPHAGLPWPDLDPKYKDDGWTVRDSGLFQGYADGTFRPNTSIPASQIETVLSRFRVQHPLTRLLVLRMLAYLLRQP